MRDGVDAHQDNPGEEMNVCVSVAYADSDDAYDDGDLQFHGYLNGTEYVAQGSNYGYPYCFAAWVPQDLPNSGNLSVGSQFAMGDPNNTINDAFCSAMTAPRLTFQAHQGLSPYWCEIKGRNND